VSKQISPWLKPFDTFQFDQPGMGAVYRVGTKRHILIDAGVAPTSEHLVAALHGTSLQGILLTHIHIDHVGSLAALLDDHSDSYVYVHRRGERHLTDPDALNENVRNTVGPLLPHYGEARPIEASRIRTLCDGEKVNADEEIRVVAVETPGHAPHHLCFFEPTHRVLFSGDALGIHRQGLHLPATAPPSFDLEASLVSLERLRRCRPEIICFAHFGCHSNGIKLIDSYRDLLIEWVRLIDQCRHRFPGNERATIEEAHARSGYTFADGVLRWELEMSIRGVVRYLTLQDPCREQRTETR